MRKSAVWMGEMLFQIKNLRKLRKAKTIAVGGHNKLHSSSSFKEANLVQAILFRGLFIQATERAAGLGSTAYNNHIFGTIIAPWSRDSYQILRVSTGIQMLRLIYTAQPKL